MTTVRQSGQQKIYLSRVTADLEVSDVAGHVDSPEALVDKADISPGFLVTSPSSYTEVFVLPSLPEEATKLTIDFRYELLIPQPRSTSRDFGKQPAPTLLSSQGRSVELFRLGHKSSDRFRKHAASVHN